MRKPRALESLYAETIERHAYARDGAQLRAIAHLDDLRQRLLDHPRDFGFFKRRMLRLLPGRTSLEPLRGVYLWGGVGRGKTMLMDLFFESLSFAERERRHFHRFMHDVHAELGRLRSRAHPLETVAHRIARRARLVCFDELFVADIADAMILGALFDGLFRRGVTLVATSNVPPGELYRDGLQRQRFLPAIRQLERHTEVVHVEGTADYRLRQLRKTAIYVDSGTADATRQLEGAFAAVAGDPGTPDGALVVEHRRIRTRRRSEGVVWFEFHDLCDGPRSQADYIELARCFHTILVSNVPRLDASSENAARRFIALIDVLYDRNVNLILSAPAPAAELYRGEKLGLEFRRTASRLIEMQSEQYLARPHRP